MTGTGPLRAARPLLAVLAALSLAGCSGCADGNAIVEQHYRECLAKGGDYHQGDGLDDFSCVRPGDR